MVNDSANLFWPKPYLNIVKFLIPILLIFGSSFYLFHSHNIKVIKFEHKTHTSTTKEGFIQEFLNDEIDGPYDPNPLKDFCKSKRRNYQPGLAIKCSPCGGGFGNIKNMMLNCLRFGLEAGGSSFIIPEIMVRSSKDLGEWPIGATKSFTYIFNLPHFIQSLTAACPQVHLYHDIESFLSQFPDAHGIGVETKLAPPELPGLTFHPLAQTVISNIDAWRSRFDEWVNNTQPPYSANSPLVVTLTGAPLLRFPMDHETPAFIATFGRLILPRADIQRLAATVLYSLVQRDNLSLSVARSGIQPGQFHGVHLRTDQDAVKYGWPSYETQSKNYLEGLKKTQLQTMYLASGNHNDSVKFLAAAAEQGIKGAMKTDLLSRDGFEIEHDQMNKLTWDQQGLIDYLVLLRSSYFSGVFESSFSWAVSNRRHVVLGKGVWETIYEGHTGAEKEGPETFVDEYSTIYGPKDMLRIRWQFPLALWP